MYIPDYFRPGDAAVCELLLRFGAADLITATPRGVRATMLPLVWLEPDGSDERGSHGLLVGHVARKNDHWQQDVVGEALTIIRGPDAYITPS